MSGGGHGPDYAQVMFLIWLVVMACFGTVVALFGIVFWLMGSTVQL